MTRFVGVACASLLLLVMVPSETARASLIVNGGFETWTDPPTGPTGAPDDLPDSWLRNVPANVSQLSFSHAPGLDGSNNSLQINPGNIAARGVYQNFTPLSNFAISFDFVAAAPAQQGQFSLRATYRSGATVLGDPRANIRVTRNALGTGDLQIIGAGSTWNTVGTITFSNFDNDDLTVYRLTLSGTVNTGNASTLKQSIRLYDVTNANLVADLDLGTGHWQSAPTSVQLQRLVFEATDAVHAPYRVDNVTVLIPEPHSMVLSGLALIGLGITRRRTSAR